MNFFAKKSFVFIVAGRVRVAFEPKSFQSDFKRIRYKAPDGHGDSVQSGPRLDPDKKFVLGNDHLDVVPSRVRITIMCANLRSEFYKRRSNSKAKTETFEFLKKAYKTRGWNV